VSSEIIQNVAYDDNYDDFQTLHYFEDYLMMKIDLRVR
jgi:hypothetical protein